jgi:hypothetical protein
VTDVSISVKKLVKTGLINLHDGERLRVTTGSEEILFTPSEEEKVR